MKTLKNDIFKKLMSKAVCETEDATENVIFIAKYNKWGIEFCTEENNVFNYYHLGFDSVDGFVEYKATKEQIKAMEAHIDNHIKEIIQTRKDDELEARILQEERNRMYTDWNYR